MQERRATLRLPHKTRTPYCPAEDFLPREGQLLNLSERGAGLLARKAHHAGERITLSVLLPGEDREPVIATGVVRWCGPSRSRGRWWPVGLEWLPMEEPARHRLRHFLSTTGATAPADAPAKRTGLDAVTRYTLISLGAVAVVLAVLWVLVLQAHNQQLQAVAEQRQAVIAALEHRERRLSTALNTAKRHLEETSGEIARVDQYAVVLTQAMGQLQDRVQQAQTSYQDLEQSYGAVRQERELLIQRVLDLEQERVRLTAKLASVQELRMAIQDAIDRRKHVRQSQRLLEMEARQAAEEAWLAKGNRGFLVREGRATVGGSTVWIRIHEPEAMLAFPPSSPAAAGPSPAASDELVHGP